MTTPNAEETDEQIREKYRKDIEAKSKHLKPISKEDFSNPTKDQKKDIKKLKRKSAR